MFKTIYKNIDYLKSAKAPFISWICPILRLVSPIKNEFIYQEGDEVKYIYFNAAGLNGFVLTKFNNTPFIRINQSMTFGFEDVTANLFMMFEEP